MFKIQGSGRPVSFGIRSLPFDIVFYMFKTFFYTRQLGTLARVCKEWMAVAYDKHLWTIMPKYRYTSRENRISLTKLCGILMSPRFSMLQHLTLPEHVKLGKTGARKLGQMLPFLKSLDAG